MLIFAPDDLVHHLLQRACSQGSHGNAFRYRGGLCAPDRCHGVGRVFYCTQVGHTIVVLHSFVKKTQETPDAELHLARKRLKDVHHG